MKTVVTGLAAFFVLAWVLAYCGVPGNWAVTAAAGGVFLYRVATYFERRGGRGRRKA